MDFTHSLWLTFFCNIKPFESKIHVCGFELHISAYCSGDPGFFELSDDFALLKTHCWGDALSVFLLSLFWWFIMESLCWIHDKCEALDKDCALWSSLPWWSLLELEPCSPESSSLHTSDLGHWTVAAGLFWLQDNAFCARMETKITRIESVFRSKENPCLIQGNRKRKEFNGLLAGALCCQAVCAGNIQG